jgi:DNA-directed RNA polymerase
MDGSNNGLQNFAAMLRDPVSGAAVNLVPSDTPSDIYQKVADVVIENISGELSTSAYAETWIDIGVNRKMTKRPVMTLPYGATIFSCRSYVSEYVKETVGPGADTVFGEGNLWEASQYMASHTWSAIGQVVVAAREAMSWLQKAARLAGAEGLPVNWTTPTGFPVMQCYYKSKAHRIKTRLGESITYLTLREELPEIDKHRQASGISPNFVHSMDSTHLMLTV